MEEVEEKILFKNTTKMDKESCKSFAYFYNAKYKKYRHITILIVFFVSFLLLGVLSPIYQSVAFGTINFAPVRTGILCLVIFIVRLIPHQMVRNKQDIEFNYEFTKDKIIIKTNTYSTQEIIYDKYNPILRVCEYGEYIYFMTSNNSAYVLKKKEFIEGKKEDFVKYIKEIYKDKYIDFNDKKQIKQLYNDSEIITTAGCCIFIVIMLAAIGNSIFNW